MFNHLSIPLPTVKLVRKWFVFGFLLRFWQNSCYTLKWLSYNINSTYAGNPWPWRIRRCVKLYFRDLLRSEILDHPSTSKTAMSAPKCRKMKFDPLSDAPGSGLFSALRINIVRQALERITIFENRSKILETKPNLTNLTESKGSRSEIRKNLYKFWN